MREEGVGDICIHIINNIRDRSFQIKRNWSPYCHTIPCRVEYMHMILISASPLSLLECGAANNDLPQNRVLHTLNGLWRDSLKKEEQYCTSICCVDDELWSGIYH